MIGATERPRLPSDYIGSFQKEVTVPDSTTKDDDSPVELGTIEVKPHPIPAHSSNSPLFQIRLVAASAPEAPPPGSFDALPLNQELLYIDKNILLDQRDLKATKAVQKSDSDPSEIDVTFSDEGRKRFTEISRKYIGRRLAIIIKERVYCAPVIRTEISGGKAVVSGNFSQQQAEDLSRQINDSLASNRE
jgi:preprotein translocase subunit SecD